MLLLNFLSLDVNMVKRGVYKCQVNKKQTAGLCYCQFGSNANYIT